MKWKEFFKNITALTLSCVGVVSIGYALDVVSEGNILGTGLGTYLLSLVGLFTVFEALHKIIFKEKKDGECEQN